jgi:hypothetical protein
MSYKHKSGSAKHKQKLEIKEKKKKLPKIDTFLTKKSDVAYVQISTRGTPDPEPSTSSIGVF